MTDPWIVSILPAAHIRVAAKLLARPFRPQVPSKPLEVAEIALALAERPPQKVDQMALNRKEKEAPGVKTKSKTSTTTKSKGRPAHREDSPDPAPPAKRGVKSEEDAPKAKRPKFNEEYYRNYDNFNLPAEARPKSDEHKGVYSYTITDPVSGAKIQVLLRAAGFFVAKSAKVADLARVVVNSDHQG